MNSIKYLWGVALIALIIAIGGYSFPQIQAGLGAAGDINTVAVRFIKGLKAGSVDQFRIDNLGMVTHGGSTFSTTTSGTVTMLYTDLIPNNTISVNPSIGTVTYTLPTRANIDLNNPAFIPNSNDTVTKWLLNASTTGSTVTGIVKIVGSLGTIVKNISTTTGADMIYAGQNARLDFKRSATSTDIYVDVTIFH